MIHLFNFAGRAQHHLIRRLNMPTSPPCHIELMFWRSAATATDRYGEWSLDRLRSNVVTLSFTQSTPLDDNNVGTAEVGFICIEKNGSRNFGATLLPLEGRYENAQDEVVVLIHKDHTIRHPIFRKQGKTPMTIFF